MRILRYKVQGQNIIRDSTCDFSNIVRGTNNYIKLIFEWDEDWRYKAKVISLRNAEGIETNLAFKEEVILQEVVTDGSMFSFVLYGKDNIEKIQTVREYVEQI